MRAVKDVRKLRREEKPEDAGTATPKPEAAKPDEAGKDKAEKPAEEETPPEFQTDRIPGAILRVSLSSHHFLSCGYDATACVLATIQRPSSRR